MLAFAAMLACAAVFGTGDEEHEALHTSPGAGPIPPDPVSPIYGPDSPPLVPADLLGRLPLPAGREFRVDKSPHVTEVLRIPGDSSGPLRVEYTLSAELTREVYEVLRRSRVQLGQALVLDPTTGELLAYAAVDPERLPPDGVYPAASLVKVVTAAAALEAQPRVADRACFYVGSPYRLTPARVHPPRRGHQVTFERALAMSNNQCFAQLAVHDLGEARMLESIERFGLLEPAAPALPAGAASSPSNPYDLGKLGSGLAGLQITPLHAARLAATLAEGKLVEPRWISRVTDSEGRELLLPDPPPPKSVISRELAAKLREMLTATTHRGTARRGFRGHPGQTLLRRVDVAGKTGSLRGTSPPGRYEWFIGVAPAEKPRLAIAVLLVQGRRWHTTPSRVAADVLYRAFCEGGVCSPDLVDRWKRGS
jgi:cell division protein FtsI/penicillin-binding protein 2